MTTTNHPSSLTRSAPLAGGRNHSRRVFAWRAAAGSLLGIFVFPLAGGTGRETLNVEFAMLGAGVTAGYGSKAGLTLRVAAHPHK